MENANRTASDSEEGSYDDVIGFTDRHGEYQPVENETIHTAENAAGEFDPCSDPQSN